MLNGKAFMKALASGAIFSTGALLGLQIRTQHDKGLTEEESPVDTSWKASETIFRSIAQEYDSKIYMDEFFMGILLLRRYLIRQAKGKTLEVSSGTGRNLKYYDENKVSSLICSDSNREMLLEAAEKAKESKVPDVQFCIANAEQLTSTDNPSMPDDANESPYGPLLRKTHEFSPGQFDTVVDTFGLCSCSDPDLAIKEMVAALKPGKGQLILLEHGKGTWNFVNRILDTQEKEHFRKWGCNFNRDIVKIIEDQENLEIVHMRRWHFGTTITCVATKKASC